MLGRIADHLRPMGIGNNQAGILRKYALIHLDRAREEQLIAVFSIVRPFPISPPILQARLDLNDHQRAVLAKSQKIAAPAGTQCDLTRDREPKADQQPTRAPRDRQRRLGLAGIRKARIDAKRQRKKMRPTMMKVGIKNTSAHAQYPKKEGIFTPMFSAIALTMKFGAFPI